MDTYGFDSTRIEEIRHGLKGAFVRFGLKSIFISKI